MIKSICNTTLNAKPIYLNEEGIIEFEGVEGAELLDVEGLEELIELGCLDPRSLRLVHLQEGVFKWKDIKEELAELKQVGDTEELSKEELIMLKMDNHSKGRYVKVA